VNVKITVGILLEMIAIILLPTKLNVMLASATRNWLPVMTPASLNEPNKPRPNFKADATNEQGVSWPLSTGFEQQC
jgi:hypothetical protein